MIILGVDPGLAKTGYGVIEVGDEITRQLDFGCIKTPAEMRIEERLCMIFDGIKEVIDKHQPDVVALEMLFFNRNTKTATQVGRSSGVILLAAGKCGVPVKEYTPLQVKECLTGFGRATKNQLREMVQIDLDMESPPRPIDASDALAIALCHHHLADLELE